MNLKHRLNYKTTATVKIISETQAIYSDEISPDTLNCLSIIEASNKSELWSKIRELSASYQSKFVPTINLITENNLQVIQLPLNAEPILIDTIEHKSVSQAVSQPF